MIHLYSIRDVARILAVPETKLRYWMQTGFIGPTVRKGGRFYYTFRDLLAVKAAKDLLAANLSLQHVRKNVDALRRALPDDTHPQSRLRLCSDGETIVALADDVAFEPIGGQIVMAFTVSAFGSHVADVLALPRAELSGATGATAAPTAIDDPPTERAGGTTAYRHFMDACAAQDHGDDQLAEHLFRQAIDLEPHMAAAITNLGNLLYRQGELEEARGLYERALEHDPVQPEARYNLANLLSDLGEMELAVAELRRVCAAAPDFADAHYNLGLLLAQLGGVAQARTHLERYLELDAGSEWASHARGYLAQLAA
jgi:tetratricopeptide (TPR) repeat protein